MIFTSQGPRAQRGSNTIGQWFQNGEPWLFRRPFTSVYASVSWNGPCNRASARSCSATGDAEEVGEVVASGVDGGKGVGTTEAAGSLRGRRARAAPAPSTRAI